MKKVLIITSKSEKTVAWQEREQYVKESTEALEAALKDTTVTYTTYADLAYSVIDDKPFIYDNRNQMDVKDFDVVHFKNWQYEVNEAPVVAKYLEAHSVLFFNSEVNLLYASGKLMQMFVLALHNVPVPDTFFAPKALLTELFADGKLPQAFTYPLILKANDGSKGDDNHLVADAKQALDILSASAKDKEYIVQNFIPNDGDYRLLYTGLENNEPLVFRRTAVAGSHLNNTSKGGTGAFVDIAKLPADYLRYAQKAAELLGREIGGVDILVDKTNGKPYVLEVNGTPALATGYGVDVKLGRLAKFLAESMEAREEE